MKAPRIIYPTAALAILCCSLASGRADDESDRADLRTIKAAYEEAVNSGDLSKIAPYLDKNVTGVMVTGEAVEGLEGLESYWKKIQTLIGPGGSYQVKVNVDKTDLFTDLAVSRGNTEDLVRLPAGKELTFSSFWTAVCRKDNGKWKVLRMQASMDPVQNVFVSSRLKLTKFFYGAGGFAIGILLVLMLRVFLRLRTRQVKTTLV
jgi:ketosteroid isomerase-like protein